MEKELTSQTRITNRYLQDIEQWRETDVNNYNGKVSVPRGYSCLRQVRNSRGARAFQADVRIRFPGRKNAVRKNKFYLFRIS